MKSAKARVKGRHIYSVVSIIGPFVDVLDLFEKIWDSTCCSDASAIVIGDGCSCYVEMCMHEDDMLLSSPASVFVVWTQ